MRFGIWEWYSLFPESLTNRYQATSPGLPAYGDLITGLLALVALIALRTGWARALALVWLFNIVGTVDLVNAVRQQNVVPLLGAAWYIPTAFVPLLLVTHYMIFVRLLKRRR